MPLLSTHRHHHTTTTTTAPRRRRGFLGRYGLTPRARPAHHHTTAAAPVVVTAPHHHQKRHATIGDKISGALLKLKGTITGRPGQKAAGTRRMHGTDGRGSHRRRRFF